MRTSRATSTSPFRPFSNADAFFVIASRLLTARTIAVYAIGFVSLFNQAVDGFFKFVSATKRGTFVGGAPESGVEIDVTDLKTHSGGLETQQKISCSRLVQGLTDGDAGMGGVGLNLGIGICLGRFL